MEGLMTQDSTNMKQMAEAFMSLSTADKHKAILANPKKFSRCKVFGDMIPEAVKPVCAFYMKYYGSGAASGLEPPSSGNLSIPCNSVKCMFPHIFPTASKASAVSILTANITCPHEFDDYFCENESLSALKHNIMGSVALFLCIVGVLANTLFVPTFNVHAIRSSCTLYLSGIAVTDTLTLILSTIIYIMQNLNSTYEGQFFFYKTFSAHLIPLGVPALELVQLLSLWFLVALLVDRFMFLRHGLSAKTMCSRSICAKVMLVMFLILFAYTIPKCLKYQLMDVPGKNGVEVKLKYTELGKKPDFRDLMKHWLRVPLEMFIPYLMIAGFGAFLLYNTLNVQVNNVKRARPHKSNSASATSNGMAPPGPRPRPPPRTTGAEAAAAAAAALNKPKETAILLENLNTQVVVGVAMLTVLLKLPTFALHILESETDKDYTKFTVAVQLLNVLCASLRPLIYVTLGRHFRVAIRTMFCVCWLPGNKFVIFNTGSRSEAMEMKAVEEGMVPIDNGKYLTASAENRLNAVNESASTGSATNATSAQQEELDVRKPLTASDSIPRHYNAHVVLDLSPAEQRLSNIDEEEDEEMQLQEPKMSESQSQSKSKSLPGSRLQSPAINRAMVSGSSPNSPMMRGEDSPDVGSRHRGYSENYLEKLDEEDLDGANLRRPVAPTASKESLGSSTGGSALASTRSVFVSAENVRQDGHNIENSTKQ